MLGVKTWTCVHQKLKKQNKKQTTLLGVKVFYSKQICLEQKMFYV